MTSQAMAESVGKFLPDHPEIRNIIYQHLTKNSRIWLSGSSPANASEFPFKLAGTCKTIYTEFVLLLAAATSLWLYEPTNARLDVTKSVAAVYLKGIKTMYVVGNSSFLVDFKKMPNLSTIHVVLGGIEWEPTSEEEVNYVLDDSVNDHQLVRFSRGYIHDHLASSAAFLESCVVPNHVELTVSVVIIARLRSKIDLWGDVNDPEGPSEEHYDAAFELHYNWRTGELLSGLEELIRAKEHLAPLFSTEADHHVMMERLLERENETEDQIEEMLWQTEAWNDRQGERFIAKGREWAFRGVIKEVVGELGPGHL